MSVCRAILIAIFALGVSAFTHLPGRGKKGGKADASSKVYIPTIGIESFIHSLGQTRPLLGNEYELAFDRFEGLVELAKGGAWSPRPPTDGEMMRALSLSELIDIEAETQKEDSQVNSQPGAELIDIEAETQKEDSQVNSQPGEEIISQLESGSQSTPSEEIEQALLFHEKKKMITEDEVEGSLNRFRKVVGGLEKYRITNPSMVADHYRDAIRVSLALEDTWGAAANALQYAGFDIKSHVSIVEVGDEDRGAPQQQIPVLQMESVCSQAAVRLLDLEFTSTGISADATKDMTKSREDTFDQRFFGQMAATQEKVQDMMLSILRVCVRAVLTRDNTPFVVVDCPLQGRGEETADVNSLEQWMPPLSAVKAVLSMDFQVVNEEEEGEVMRFFVAESPEQV